jgi:hypothetical protein
MPSLDDHFRALERIRPQCGPSSAIESLDPWFRVRPLVDGSQQRPSLSP